LLSAYTFSSLLGIGDGPVIGFIPDKRLHRPVVGGEGEAGNSLDGEVSGRDDVAACPQAAS